MSKFLLIIAFAIAFVSCAKKSISPESFKEEIEFIELLNQGEYKEALSSIDHKLQEAPENLNLHYWRAQALAGLGGVDIYKLFPIVKLKLFSVAIEEWSSMENFANRNADARQLGFFGEVYDENEVKKLVELRKDFEENDRNNTIEYKILSARITGEYNSRCSVHYQIESKYFISEFKDYKTYFSIPPGQKCVLPEGPIQDSIFFIWFRSTVPTDINARINKIEEHFYRRKYLKVGFAVYESLPYIRMIKNINDFELDRIFDSLSALDRIYNNGIEEDR